MSILPSFEKSNDLLLKLCRESLSVCTSENEQEISDHFFNFCITSQSLRDWCGKEIGVGMKDIHDKCNTFEQLKMCRDIANSCKHFGLDKGKSSTVKDVNEDQTKFTPLGNKDTERVVVKPSLVIISENGNKVELKDFMSETIEAWISVFYHFSIPRDDKFYYIRSLETQVGDYVISYF